MGRWMYGPVVRTFADAASMRERTRQKRFNCRSTQSAIGRETSWEPRPLTGAHDLVLGNGLYRGSTAGGCHAQDFPRPREMGRRQKIPGAGPAELQLGMTCCCILPSTDQLSLYVTRDAPARHALDGRIGLYIWPRPAPSHARPAAGRLRGRPRCAAGRW